MSEGAEVIPFQLRLGSEADDVEVAAAAERDAVLATLATVLQNQQAYEEQMSLAIKIIGEMQSRVRDLEHEVARLKKKEPKDPKKPVILNAHGARAN